MSVFLYIKYYTIICKDKSFCQVQRLYEYNCEEGLGFDKVEQVADILNRLPKPDIPFS